MCVFSIKLKISVPALAIKKKIYIYKYPYLYHDVMIVMISENDSGPHQPINHPTKTMLLNVSFNFSF